MTTAGSGEWKGMHNGTKKGKGTLVRDSLRQKLEDVKKEVPAAIKKK